MVSPAGDLHRFIPRPQPYVFFKSFLRSSMYPFTSSSDSCVSEYEASAFVHEDYLTVHIAVASHTSRQLFDELSLERS